MPDKPAEQPSVIVVGGGPAGLTAAITLASSGLSTVLVGKRPAQPDNRTTALFAGSIAALETLEVWPLCAAQAAPMRAMRIVDDTGRLWRAPEVKFEAGEIDLDTFGYNIENFNLVAALEQRAAALSHLRIVEDEVRSVTPGEDAVTLTLATGNTLHAPLVVAADGRRSLCREAAGIDIDARDYPQAALTVCLKHTRPITTPRPNSTRRAGRSRWCRCRANARASCGCSIRRRPTSSARWMMLRSPWRSNAPRIRSSARSRSSPGAGCFRCR